MGRWGLSLVLGLMVSGAFAGTACSKSESPADDGTPTKDGGSGDTGSTTLPSPTGDAGTVTTPTTDSGTPAASDGGIQGPSFDLTKIASIQGTFITDQSAVAGAQTNATVTWSFKIDNISDMTQTSGTARWNVQATNVTNGNMSDFGPDTNVDMTVTNVSGKADFNTLSPSYVLVQVNEGKIVDFYFYRRVVDDTETNPTDKPHNVTYTTTAK